MLLRSLQIATEALRHQQRLFVSFGNFWEMVFARQPQLQLAGLEPLPSPQDYHYPNDTNDNQDHLWFAVPKSKVTRSKKRMKTTLQNRIKMKHNITLDPRTGEVTLQHKLPFNWKDYLPETATKTD
jgi:ribosomal protein L32